MNSIPTQRAKWIALFIIACVAFLFIAKCSALTSTEREVVVQMKDTIKELTAKYESQLTVTSSLSATLSLSVAQASALTASAKAAQDQAMLMTAERDLLKSEAIVKDAKIAKLNSQYQFAQFIIAGVSAFAAALLVFYFTKSLPMPYNVLAPLGAAGFVYGIITFLI